MKDREDGRTGRMWHEGTMGRTGTTGRMRIWKDMGGWGSTERMQEEACQPETTSARGGRVSALGWALGRVLVRECRGDSALPHKAWPKISTQVLMCEGLKLRNR